MVRNFTNQICKYFNSVLNIKHFNNDNYLLLNFDEKKYRSVNLIGEKLFSKNMDGALLSKYISDPDAKLFNKII